MSRDIILDKSTTRGHSCYFYNGAEDRFKLLAQYFKQGLDKNELCILVTAESQDDAIQYLTNNGLDALKHVNDKSLRIFEMISTYLNNGKFIADFMLTNVNNFILSAQKEGYSGLRTAGEMNWMKEYPESVEEAIDYEHQVNNLDTVDSSFIGLCLYETSENYSHIIEEAADAHSSLIHDGRIELNPGFSNA